MLAASGSAGQSTGVLVSLLNSSQAKAQYSIAIHTSEESATRTLKDTIDRDVPGIALVYGDQHWLVVDGYKHTKPNSAPAAGRKLKGLLIRNPWKNLSGHYVALATWYDKVT